MYWNNNNKLKTINIMGWIKQFSISIQRERERDGTF